MNKETELNELLVIINNEILEQKPEIYWNRNDGLNHEQKSQIINGGYFEVVNDIFEYNIDYIYDLERDAVKEVLGTYEEKLIELLSLSEYNDVEDIYDILEDRLEKPSVDLNIKDLIRNDAVKVRVTLSSKYDCINSHWFESQGGYSYKESYFGAMVDFLKLNPKKVKELLLSHNVNTLGRYPDYNWREGKELVSYEDFYQELKNSCCGANNLIILGKIDLQDFIDVESPKYIVFPKGTYLGLYSSFQGGGSLLEMKLIKDTKFRLGQIGKSKYDSLNIVTDTKDNGYDTDTVYGLTSQCYKVGDLQI